VQNLRADGSHDVAVLLRNLADAIEHRTLAFEGLPLRIADSPEAVVDLQEGGLREIALIEIRLEQAAPGRWNLTRTAPEPRSPWRLTKPGRGPALH
jgi:hypothetical protein